MKIFMVKGNHKTGKTTTCINIIAELVRRGYSVGSIKDIHFEGLELDHEDTDSWRHARAGASTVTARGTKVTGVFYNRQVNFDEIIQHYHEDIVLIEGEAGVKCPNIVAGKDTAGLDARRDELTVGFSGIVSNELVEHAGLPVINATTDIAKLVDLVEANLQTL